MYHPYDLILPFNMKGQRTPKANATEKADLKPKATCWDALSRWEDEGGAMPDPPAGSISAQRRATRR